MDKANSAVKIISDELIDRALADIDIPLCPQVVTDLLAEVQKDEPDIRRIVKSINHDASMSVTVLKLANSPYFSSGQPVLDLQKAVARLGIKNLFCVVVSAALRASANGDNSPQISRFWDHIASVAAVSGMIARRMPGVAPEMAYTYALFHDAAIPVMLKKFPEYAAVLKTCEREGTCLVDTERATLPFTHPVVGAMLVRHWGLGAEINQAIRHHHEPDLYELPETVVTPATLTLISITQIAEFVLSEATGEAQYDVTLDMFNNACRHLGYGDDDIDELRERIHAYLNQ